MLGMIMSIVLINVLGNGLLPIIIDPVNETLGAQYNPDFYNILVPITVGLSLIYTILALLAIWNKDRPEFWGVGDTGTKTTFKDYLNLFKANKPIKWLVLSAGFNKLASTISTSAAVAILLYEIMMGSYNGLYMPIYALSFVFMGVFFLLGSKTAGEKGQKRAVAQYTTIAFLFYIVLVAMLLIWNPENKDTILSLVYWDDNNKMHISINVFTIIWIVIYGCGYGAYNCCSEMCIPMVADCTDYETYRSGKYVPGIMGTIFSLVDKLVSSFATLLTTVFTVYLIPGLNGSLPSTGVDLAPIINSGYQGVKLSAIICICLLPMASWLITMFAMTRYDLSGDKLKEIQAVNAVRKEAIEGGMSLEEAMATWKTIDQVPARFVCFKDNEKKKQSLVGKITDVIYNYIWGKKDMILVEPSSNVIEIPEQYRK
jgi:Na+/melibiose symporter-like transporter